MMKAVVLNCSLKPSPEPSNTDALITALLPQFSELQIQPEVIRLADKYIPPGVSTQVDDTDDWPAIHQAILASEILIVASPTWLGHPSSIAQRALERMDAMISETAEEGLPVAYNKAAGVIVTGNEDGAHHVISEISGSLIDIGFTVPGQAWTYWNRGPGPGPSFTETDEGHEWSITTGRTAISVLAAVANALKKTPIPPHAYKAGG